MTEPRTIYIETYGCQMNKLDSETVAAILEDAGFTMTCDMTAADAILLNTCGVRENAENRIHGRIGELSSMRKDRPGLIFGIIGCMAQRLNRALLSNVVRIVAGPDSYRRLPGLIHDAMIGDAVDTRLDTSEVYADIDPVRESPFSAWVAVMRGCNNFCSYCIVPHTRGRERSIPAGDIVAEVARLHADGYREVTLLGQNVNSYHDGEVDFARLLEQVAATGIGWVRFLTSHPKDLNEDTLRVMTEYPNVCNHLHLPLQSGSDRILSAMNRRYTVGDYLSKVDRARSMVNGISISTDMIFGFPGETEEDFRATMELMERVRYDFAFLYRYSERAGTAACDLPGSVPEAERIRRLKAAIELQQAISSEKNRGLIKSEQVMLVKDRSKDGEGWYGFTETTVPAIIRNANHGIGPGSFVRMRVTATTGASLVGEPV